VRGGLSPYTLHGYARAWRTFFRWCVQHDYLRHNPATLLKQPPLPEQPPKALLPDDLARLLTVARDAPRDYAIVCFLADTGCRVGGLVGLRLGDLHFDTGRAVVWEKGCGGERKSRTVYMKACTVESLRAYLRARPVEAEARVLQGQRGPLTTSGVYQLLKRLARKAKITSRHNPHAFRHGFARGALQNGADIGTVAQLLGHSDVSITVRFYARWADEELKAKHAAVSWLPEG
jgi:integrase/recombinase XerD